VSLIFGGLARVRGDRAFHPDGVVMHGTFRALGSSVDSALLGGSEERRALLRISRAVGLPEALPDVLGCAIRVPDAYGRGRHQDFALASSFKAPLGRHALVPARDFLGAFYSSLLPYRLAGETRLLGARSASEVGSGYARLDELSAAIASGAALSMTLLAASPLGSWEPIATMRAEEVASKADARELRFNPWNTGGGIEPLGFLQGLRDPAYRASQAASPGS
jgi:hypothetical protein